MLRRDGPGDGPSRERPRPALRRLASPRMVVLALLAITLQAVHLFMSLEDPALEPLRFRSPQKSDATDPAASLRDLPYDKVEWTDRVLYSKSEPGLRDCTGGAPDESAAPPVTIVTFVGRSGQQDHPGYINFLKSLDANGYNRLLVLEPSDDMQEIRQFKRTNYSAEVNFWVYRLNKFLVAAQSFPSDAVIVFCDALDVYFTQPPSILVERFRKRGKRVVFAAEALCDTVSCRRDVDLKDFLIRDAPAGNAYRFLNAGMFMGLAADLQIVLRCAIKFATDGRDDQNAFTLCYREDRKRIGLDYDSVLFGNIPPVQELFDDSWTTFRNEGVGGKHATLLHRRHLSRETIPVALHFLGMSYRRDLPFAPCQEFLRHKYNELGDMIHLNDLEWINSPQPATAVDIVVLSSSILHVEELQSSHASAASPFSHMQQLSSCPIPGSKYLTAVRLSGLFELIASIKSLLPPQQKLNSDIKISGVIRKIYAYITVRPADHVILDKIKSFNLKAGDLGDIWNSLAACVGSAFKATFSTDMVDWNVVFGETFVNHVAGNITRFAASPFHCLQWVLDSERSRDTTPHFLVTTTGQHMYGSRVIVSLVEAHQSARHSAAYGYSGRLIDMDRPFPVPVSAVTGLPVGAGKDQARSAAYMRSAQHWSNSPQVVDLLSSEGAALYDYSTLASFSFPSSRLDVHRGCLFPYELDALLSNILAVRGIPRVQVPITPWLGAHSLDLLLPGIGPEDFFTVEKYNRICDHEKLIRRNAEDAVRYTSVYQKANSIRQDLVTCRGGIEFVENIKRGWQVRPEEGGTSAGIILNKDIKPGIKNSGVTDIGAVKRPVDFEALKFCSHWTHGQNSFTSIPSVPPLDGFSWKQNWVIESATSPCTAHLYTRIVDGQLFLGKGQYMGYAQFIASRSGEYILRLDVGPQLCLYGFDNLNSGPIKCIIVPPDVLSASEETDGKIESSYVALVNGSVCFFRGKTPNFGGSASDSGHQKLVWCSSNIPPSDRHRKLLAENTINQKALTGYKNRLGSMMKSVCTKLYVPPSSFEDLFLFIVDDGTFGLYTSKSCLSSHDLCSPDKRTRAVSLLKCFN